MPETPPSKLDKTKAPHTPEQLLEAALRESFPASDPISITTPAVDVDAMEEETDKE